MIKEKRILSYFICWLLLGLFICFIGISKTYALENYENIGYLTDNTNFGVMYDGVPNGIPQDIPVSQEWNLSGFNVNRFILEIENYNFKADSTYNLELSLPLSVLTNSVEYSVTIYDANTPQNHVSCNVGTINNYNPNYPNFTFKCPLSTNKITLEIYSSNNTSIVTDGWFRWNYSYLSKYIDKDDIIISGQEQIKDTITDNLTSKCSNLFDYNMEPYVVALDGINYTNNKGVFTFNGTGGGYKFIVYKMYLEKGTYNFGSIDSGGTLDGYSAILEKGTDDVVFCYGGNCKVTLNNDGEILFYIFRIGSEVLTFNNFIAKPYISPTSTSWCEYGTEVNKIDETNNQLGNLNDSLNNPNIDGSLGSAGSFFDSFTTTDHGGLSGIITAPLVSINQMLNTSCSPMTATFQGKELSLPCGYEFWNRLGAIRDFINIALGGMLCYRIIIKLYKLIERIKNPEDDRIEVLDL